MSGTVIHVVGSAFAEELAQIVYNRKNVLYINRAERNLGHMNRLYCVPLESISVAANWPNVFIPCWCQSVVVRVCAFVCKSMGGPLLMFMVLKIAHCHGLLKHFHALPLL